MFEKTKSLLKGGKKGQATLSVLEIGMVVVVLAIIFLILGYTAKITQDLRDGQSVADPSYEIMDIGLNDTLARTSDVQTGGDVAVAAVIIGMLLTTFLGGILAFLVTK